MAKSDKPTVEMILARVERIDKIQAGVEKNWAGDDEYYECAFKGSLNLPAEYEDEGVVLPTARGLVDAVTDLTEISNARVYVNKKGETQVDKDEAEMERKFGTGLIYRTNVDAAISPWRVAAKHYWLYGLAIFSCKYAADMWPDKPIMEGGETEAQHNDRMKEWDAETEKSLPIIITALNPRNCLIDPTPGNPQYVIERQTKLVADVVQKYPHWGNPTGRELKEDVTFISYWDRKYHCDLIDEEPVLKVGRKGSKYHGIDEHGYGFLPYVLINSGLGNEPYDNDMSKRYVGVLRYLKDLLVSESRTFSKIDILNSKNIMPWMTAEGEGAVEFVGQEGGMKQEYGQIIPLPANVKIVEYTPKMAPSEAVQHLAVTSSFLAEFGAPKSLRGVAEGGVRSGAHERVRIAQAATRIRYSEMSFKHRTAKVLDNCARLLVNKLPGNVRLQARTPTEDFDMVIDKSEMKEPFNYYVEFAAVSEEDEYRRHDDIERLLQSGVYTMEKAWQSISGIDPEQMALQKQVELLNDNPLTQQVVAQVAVVKLQEAMTRQMGADAIALQMPGAEGPGPGGQGGPPEMMGGMTQGVPNRAGPGSAQDLQNKLKANRSQTPMSPTQGKGGGGAPRRT